jgi:tripeptide aminopeptidase
MINESRLADFFKTLVEIDSPSRNERGMAEELSRVALALGGEVFEDRSGNVTGSNAGNLVIKFVGNRDVEPMLLSAHMDTVEPANGVTAVFKDGVFSSAGETILGSDDKSALAIIFEAIQVLRENDLPWGPIELVITTCEEIGLQGAKNLDFSLITARFGYVLDTTDTDIIVNRAPAANRLEFKVFGKDAHAGVAPENGINAVSIASRAIAGLEMGRLDAETTCNIGTIQGGVATNIVPSLVTVEGEVRSHSQQRLDDVTRTVVRAFEEAVAAYQPQSGVQGWPKLEVDVKNDFPLTNIPEDQPVIVMARQAAANLGRKLDLKTTGGGADANVFFQHGIMTGVLGTGMTDVHTVRESIALADMVKTAALLLEIIRLHAM